MTNEQGRAWALPVAGVLWAGALAALWVGKGHLASPWGMVLLGVAALSGLYLVIRVVKSTNVPSDVLRLLAIVLVAGATTHIGVMFSWVSPTGNIRVRFFNGDLANQHTVTVIFHDVANGNKTIVNQANISGTGYLFVDPASVVPYTQVMNIDRVFVTVDNVPYPAGGGGIAAPGGTHIGEVFVSFLPSPAKVTIALSNGSGYYPTNSLVWQAP